MPIETSGCAKTLHPISDHEVKTSELELKHDLSPQIFIRMIDCFRLIHATGDRWQCDRSESNSVKAKEAARLADVTFYDKVFSPGSVYGRIKLG